MILPFSFDWKNPDYVSVFEDRHQKLKKIREAQENDPLVLPSLYLHYKNNPVDFIIDWGCTVDPRNASQRKPVVMPFILFPRQIELAHWILDRWHNQEPGVVPKSRDMGVSWVSLALATSVCLFNDDIVVGFGSRKLELVDKLGDPDSLFWKVREFMSLLPVEFRRGWTRADAPEKLIKFPATNSAIKGEGGDEIGRGGRTSIYFVDESAFLERPQTVEASLSNTTNSRIDLSSYHGTNNPFYYKTQQYKPEWVFPFHWRDDPRKNEEWYKRMVEKFDPVTIAQEVDMNPSGAVTGIVIPSAWVNAAVDAHIKLGIKPTGERFGALDVADEGIDLNAFCGAHGIVVEYIETWSGKGGDVYETAEKAIDLCDSNNYLGFHFDADGLGAGVRGDSRKINEERKSKGLRQIESLPFRGSGAVVDPEKIIPSAYQGDLTDKAERKNEDYFANYKAQSWWALRLRFLLTYRAVVQGMEYDKDSIISISSNIPNYLKLVAELSQPTYSINGAGKVLIDKAPNCSRSPNMADAVMIKFAPRKRPRNTLFGG